MATKFLCSIPDCDNPVKTGGWCNLHYRRWLRHGDPLGGRTPQGVPLRYLEETVLPFEGNECLPWPYNRHSAGYGMIHINGPKYVHRIACEHVNGPPPSSKHEAAHLCGNGHNGCVNPHHLMWKTHQENKADELLHGTRNSGERQGIAKLTNEIVLEIRASDERGCDLAERHGVSRSVITEIRKSRSWRHLLPGETTDGS